MIKNLKTMLNTRFSTGRVLVILNILTLLITSYGFELSLEAHGNTTVGSSLLGLIWLCIFIATLIYLWMKPCIGKIPIAKILVVINAVSFLGLTNLVDNIIFNVVSLLVLLVTMIYLWIKK